MDTAQNTYPLRAIRLSKKLKASEVVERGRAIDPNFPVDPEAVLNWERRGVMRHSVLSTLAKIYQMDLDELAAVAAPTKS